MSVCLTIHIALCLYIECILWFPSFSGLISIDFGDTQKGGTFTVRWLSIYDLPFDHTNHLCNPWNGGRPVKFSRDGQAVPRDVGDAVVRLLESGVREFGQGSAILRKPIRIEPDGIAVQKVFVNGRFVAATDYNTARTMLVADEQRQSQRESQRESQRQSQTEVRSQMRPQRVDRNREHHGQHGQQPQHSQHSQQVLEEKEAVEALQKLAQSLQAQGDGQQGIQSGNLLDGLTVEAVAKLLGKEKERKRRHHRRRGGHRDDERHESRSHDHRSSHHRERERSRRHRHGDGHRERSRDRSDRRKRRRSRSGSGYSSDSSGAPSRRSRRRKRGSRSSKMDQDQVNVINSLWTQIQLQQALMSQSGLYNVVNGEGAGKENQTVAATAAPAAVYPSNRGGVY